MSDREFNPSAVDEHIGQRIQLRRMMMGMSQKDLAQKCGVTFQQIQKYERAGNRISAARLFELSTLLETPMSFFFWGLPGNLPEETRSTRSIHVSEPTSDDPLAKNETLELINLYWRLPTDEMRETIMRLIKSLSGTP